MEMIAPLDRHPIPVVTREVEVQHSNGIAIRIFESGGKLMINVAGLANRGVEKYTHQIGVGDGAVTMETLGNG